MNKETPDGKNILSRLKTKQVQDYTYAILFLLVSSFFAFFVIRPVLAIAIGLRKEGQDLQRINTVYEQNISKVLELQADLELVRPKRYLLEEALPNGPKLDALIQDIQRVAQSQNITLEGVTIGGIQIKDPLRGSLNKSASQTYGAKIDIGINGNYEDADKFLRALSQQRRIKTIETIDIIRNKDSQASGSAAPASIKLRMSVQAYYL